MIKARDYKVAIIADEFTFNSFSSEFQAHPINPDDWQEVFERVRPNIFFCESAWNGSDSETKPWRGQVYARKPINEDNHRTLRSILTYCQSAGIPTVFWNKEDPVHHDGPHGGFADTAKHFDFVFTTAVECVESYRDKFKVKNAHVLPFATNPRLFNPIEIGQRSQSMVFAGTWYANYWARIYDMETILDRMIADSFELTIYDRCYGTFNPVRQWPEKYKQYIYPSKSHDEMPAVYKSSIYGLNFNTIINSKTMFARRAFELMSSNTLVVSNYAEGLEEMFGPLVVFADKEPDRLSSLSIAQVNQIRHAALHEVLKHHTYKARWHTILTRMGLPHERDDPTLTFVAAITGEQEASTLASWFQQYGSQRRDAALLLIADDSMAPSFVSELNQKLVPLRATVSFRHQISQGASGDYHAPLATSHFVALSNELMNSPKRLDEALLHLQYMDAYPLAPSATARTQYQIEKVDARGAFIDTSDRFSQWFSQYIANQKIEAYLV